MMRGDLILAAVVLMPLALAGMSLTAPSAAVAIRAVATGTLAVAVAGLLAAARVIVGGPAYALHGWLMLDALSALHLAVMMAVFALGAVYSAVYFAREIRTGALSDREARRYAALWFGALASMALVLVSNNLGLMWVGVEATTLATAFLICVHATPSALEAMWKYLLMCSVGVALAFMGILLVAASAGAAHLSVTERLLWTRLMDSAGGLDPALMKAGFIFLVVGYGTKAGLAPMHNWLPDAHSQAPAPVSAMFSGFLLNSALYCILRALPLAEAATGHAGWASGILVAIGLLSVLVAATFILFQHDLKRMLAYCSVEHIGLIALGAGVGGLGAVAAMLHTAAHSLAKVAAFCGAGSLGQLYGTLDMRRIAGSVRRSPLLGGGLAASVLALVACVPFALFVSEFLLLKALLDRRAYAVAILLLAGLALVFIGMVRPLFPMAWGRPPSEPIAASDVRTARRAGILIAIPLAALVAFGVWMPTPVWNVFAAAAAVLGGAR